MKIKSFKYFREEYITEVDELAAILTGLGIGAGLWASGLAAKGIGKLWKRYVSPEGRADALEKKADRIEKKQKAKIRLKDLKSGKVERERLATEKEEKDSAQYDRDKSKRDRDKDRDSWDDEDKKAIKDKQDSESKDTEEKKSSNDKKSTDDFVERLLDRDSAMGSSKKPKGWKKQHGVTLRTAYTDNKQKTHTLAKEYVDKKRVKAKSKKK